MADASDLEHFLAIPWCAEVLAAPNIRPWVPVPSRVSKASGEDALFARTLHTRDTFSALLLFHDEPADEGARIDNVGALVTLGPGVQGYPQVAHGGIVATILDEVLGGLPAINTRRGLLPEVAFMTSYLHTTFVRPVPVPGTVLVRARIAEASGRKLFLQGTLSGPDGTELARADALFVSVRRTPRL